MSSAAQSQPLLTAEEFGKRPDPGYPEELVRGRIVAMPAARPRHGEICTQASYLLRRYLDDHNVGRVVGNDSGIVTERGPDTVRGADVAYYSFERVPRGPLPTASYLEVAPELVFEVLSPSDRWPKVLAKVAEYLNAGVLAVCVLDPERSTLHLHECEQPARILSAEDELTLPEILPGFRVAVRRFFE